MGPSADQEDPAVAQQRRRAPRPSLDEGTSVRGASRAWVPDLGRRALDDQDPSIPEQHGGRVRGGTAPERADLGELTCCGIPDFRRATAGHDDAAVGDPDGAVAGSRGDE
jgi:hypothetical protein